MKHKVGLFQIMALSGVLLGSAGCEQPTSDPSASAPQWTAGSPLAQAQQIVLDGLADPEPQLRANAIEVVATAREVRLMPPVQRLLQDPAIRVRFNALLAVGDLEYVLAKDDVARLVNDPDPNIKIAAAYAMMKLGQPEFFQALRDAATSKDLTVRANAALLLGKSGRQEALRLLYWTLRGDDSTGIVIQNAAESIAMLGDERIYPKLWTQLISAYADDRMMGIRAMGALGSEDAKNAITTLLDDMVLEVRLVAAQQLGRLRDAIGEPEVQAVFEKDLLGKMDAQTAERVKILTALAIGEIGTEGLIKHLPQLLADDSRTVRLAAAKATLQTKGR